MDLLYRQGRPVGTSQIDREMDCMADAEEDGQRAAEQIRKCAAPGHHAQSLRPTDTGHKEERFAASGLVEQPAADDRVADCCAHGQQCPQGRGLGREISESPQGSIDGGSYEIGVAQGDDDLAYRRRAFFDSSQTLQERSLRTADDYRRRLDSGCGSFTLGES
jgi:hypothetical protein